jgi:hypothetical protein
MKKILLALLIVSGASASFANSSMKPSSAFIQEEKTKIKEEELPEAVKTALKGDTYKDWTVSAAYTVKSTSQYEVELKKGIETKVVKFDKDGKAL